MLDLTDIIDMIAVEVTIIFYNKKRYISKDTYHTIDVINYPNQIFVFVHITILLLIAHLVIYLSYLCTVNISTTKNQLSESN